MEQPPKFGSNHKKDMPVYLYMYNPIYIYIYVYNVYIHISYIYIYIYNGTPIHWNTIIKFSTHQV